MRIAPWMISLAGFGGAASAAVPSTPAAKVEANSVMHSGAGVTVRVPAAASFVGSDRFELYGVADAEVHVFAESDVSRRLRRLYWVQFESYLPAKPELSYNYADGNRRIELGGTATWLRAGPVSTGGQVRPGSDREHVIAILKRAGIAIPAR